MSEERRAYIIKHYPPGAASLLLSFEKNNPMKTTSSRLTSKEPIPGFCPIRCPKEVIKYYDYQGADKSRLTRSKLLLLGLAEFYQPKPDGTFSYRICLPAFLTIYNVLCDWATSTTFKNAAFLKAMEERGFTLETIQILNLKELDNHIQKQNLIAQTGCIPIEDNHDNILVLACSILPLIAKKLSHPASHKAWFRARFKIFAGVLAPGVVSSIDRIIPPPVLACQCFNIYMSASFDIRHQIFTSMKSISVGTNFINRLFEKIIASPAWAEMNYIYMINNYLFERHPEIFRNSSGLFRA